jgi:hypothetical protein
MAATRSLRAHPESQLQSFIAKFEPTRQSLIKDVRAVLRTRFAGANELVYDNYNFFVIGYSATERPSDSIVSLAAGASGVGLSFPYCGAKLPDPHKLLLGSGAKNRFIRLDSPAVLRRREVKALLMAAEKMCKPLSPSAEGQLIIRSVSAKQRPRRK